MHVCAIGGLFVGYMHACASMMHALYRYIILSLNRDTKCLLSDIILIVIYRCATV